MSRNKRYPTNGVINEAYPRPPKPPTYNRPSGYYKGTSKNDFRDRNTDLTLPKNKQIEKIKVRDYANFEDFDKGGRKQSKKQEFYQKVRKMDPRKGHELPYETLHPDDGSKQAGYQGGKIKTHIENRVLYFSLRLKSCDHEVRFLRFEYDS